MHPNPYKSPETKDAANKAPAGHRRPTALPLVLLTASIALTLLLAGIDAHQEQANPVFVLQVTFWAAAAQLPGLFFAELYRKSGTRISFIFLVPAFVVAACSLMAYIMYVAVGRVQTVNNAAQMHVVFVPILLVTLSFVSYAITGVAAGILALTRPKRNELKDSNRDTQ